MTAYLSSPFLFRASRPLLAAGVAIQFSAFAHAQGAPDVYAITNARIVPVGSKTIEKGTVVLRDGLIVAVGDKAEVPADARVIDGTGLTLYPGLIDGYSHVGMPAASDYTASGRGDGYPVVTVRSENTAISLMKPDPATFSALERTGFGAALAAPYVGIFAGTSAVVSLSGATDPAALLVRAPVAMHLNFGAPDPAFGYPSALMGEIALTRQSLYDALDAAARLDAYEKNPAGRVRPTIPRAVSALRPVVDKKLPLVAHANSAQEIRRVLHLAREFGLRPVIEGGTEAYAVADELKKANASVLLSADLPEAPRVPAGEEDPSTLQGLRRRALAPTSAAALQKAGVPFALTTSGLTNPADFIKNVRRLIAAGLSEEDAIAASTINSAKMLGVERQLGTLEPGKIANLVAVEGGTLFDAKAKFKYVFVDGKKVNLEVAGGGATPGAGGRGGGAAAFLSQLPPGVTPEMARQFLQQNPNGSRQFLPAGVTPEQALAALNGDEGQGAGPGRGAAGREEPATAAPPPVGQGLIPPLPPALPASFVLRGATVWTSGPQGKLTDADVYVKEGKIAAVGAGLKVPGGTLEVDAKGKHVTPGMIDCHSHTAIDGGVNEGSNIITAECRIQDVIDAEDVNIYRQLAGGTTAANMLHGSANAVGGQNAVVKWRWGTTAEEMKIAGAPEGIKFALGENPTRSNGNISRTDIRRYPATRMGVERVLRDGFTRARDYREQQNLYKAGKIAQPPKRDLQLDALVEILDGKRLVHCHSYRQDEILMLIRLADEFGFHVATFQHVLEGYKVADEIAKHGAGASTFSDWWGFKIEAADAIPYNGALLTDRGVVTSFNSDSSELARRLNLEAAKAVRYGGLKPEEALKLVTINPAKQLRIDKMTGSLEPGKDADIVVWSGDPLSNLAYCEKTFVDGKLYFDRAADLAARPALEAEKKRLAEALAPRPTPGGGGPGGRRPQAAATPPADAPKPEATAAAAPTTPSVQTVVPRTTTPPPAPTGPITAIVGATIHPVTGPAIPNGVLLMQGGRITGVGASGAVTVPAGAKTVDAKGLHAYPGLIDADTTLGVNEIGSRRETQDFREMGDFSPELRIAVAVNPDVDTIQVARSAGVLNAVSAPAGGTLSGMGALLDLDGWTWEDLAVNPTVGLYLNFPTLGLRRFRETAHRCEETAGSPDDAIEQDPAFRSDAFVPAGSRDTEALRYGYFPDDSQQPQVPQTPPAPGTTPGPGAPGGGRRFGRGAQGAPGGFAGAGTPTADSALKPLNDFLEEARRYRDARNAEAKGAPFHARDPRLEAMLPVLEGKVPLFVRADRERDIRAAAAWAKKEGFRIVLIGGQEADKCADFLAKEQIPVILGPVMNLPRQDDSAYDDAYSMPQRLVKAGVRICLSTGNAADVRWLPQHAAMAAAYGLSPDEALKAITLYPAQILGAGDRLGSLETGKCANLILTTGDPLEVTSEIKAAFVEGNPVDLSNKQSRLYDKYRARPKPGN